MRRVAVALTLVVVAAAAAPASASPRHFLGMGRARAAVVRFEAKWNHVPIVRCWRNLPTEVSCRVGQEYHSPPGEAGWRVEVATVVVKLLAHGRLHVASSWPETLPPH
ncbi:MAG TPA: hypothetical protein VN618_08135 [Solirubrobacteraceae bacterium]|nr:hypothetical protein [Solirubrobacteraceae bacterium]